mmetsp:Transcript_101379/g.316032  ORF Transcript_101379/g.316032 Transcript_101379/m.316032 type:complete len:424 (+) Transcript_101379:55-1326(+)
MPRGAAVLGLACVLLGAPGVAGVRILLESPVEGGRAQALEARLGSGGAELRSLQTLHEHQDGSPHPPPPPRGQSLGPPGVQEPPVGPLAYAACVLLTVAVVVSLHWSRSAGEICSIVAYLLALTSVRLSVKAVFVECGFNFPLAVSAVHFVAAALAAFGVLLGRRLKGGQAVPIPTRSDFLFEILPIAMCFATCIGLGNRVLELSSVAFAEILAAVQPMMSIPVLLLLGMPFDPWLLLPTCLVVVGCAVCSLGDVRFTGLGLALAAVSNVLRAAKAVLQQKLLARGREEGGLDPCALLAWASLPSAALMLAWSAAAEGAAPLLRLMSAQDRWLLASSVALSSVPATILNLSQLFVVAGLGAVGSQIVAQLKIALTILGGVVLLGEPVSLLQGAGFAAVLVGTFVYSRWDKATDAAPRKREVHG